MDYNEPQMQRLRKQFFRLSAEQRLTVLRETGLVPEKALKPLPQTQETRILSSMADGKVVDVLAEVGRFLHCNDCKFCFCECGEDIVCGHSLSYAATVFGLSVNAARREGNFCGPDGVYFVQRT